MVAIPFLIAAAALAMVEPDIKASGQSSSSPKMSSSLNVSRTTWAFGCGVVFGMCLTSAVSYEARRRRLWERLRLSFLSFWSDSMDKGMKRLDKYRKPTLMDTIDKTAVSGTMPKSNSKPQQQTEMEALPPSAIRQEAVSPNWCATSGMRVTIITLFPGSEIVPQPSLGVEFYYVVKGKGEYLKEGIDAAFSMAAGSCLVVDPNTTRGFKTKGRSEFVLLRATDNGTTSEDDTIQRDSSMYSTSDILNAGLQTVEAMVKQYSTNGGKLMQSENDMAFV